MPNGATTNKDQMKTVEACGTMDSGRNLKTHQHTRNPVLSCTTKDKRPNTRGAQMTSTYAATSSRAPYTGARNSVVDPTFIPLSNRELVGTPKRETYSPIRH